MFVSAEVRELDELEVHAGATRLVRIEGPAPLRPSRHRRRYGPWILEDDSARYVVRIAPHERRNGGSSPN